MKYNTVVSYLYPAHLARAGGPIVKKSLTAR